MDFAPTELAENIEDYVNGTGIFKNLQHSVLQLINIADHEVSPLFWLNLVYQFIKYFQSKTPDLVKLFNDFTFPHQKPPPLIELATWILSVTANSASCEHLFSVFGDILTRKRNCLSANNLHTLAELKLHIQNELQEQKIGACIHKIFKRRATLATPSASCNPSDTPQSMEINPTLADQAEENAEKDTWEQDGAFETVMDRHIEMLANDGDDSFEPVTGSDKWESCTISELFDFSKTHWQTLYSKTALCSFDKELATYKLLDLDAQGENDDKVVDADDITRDILIG